MNQAQLINEREMFETWVRTYQDYDLTMALKAVSSKRSVKSDQYRDPITTAAWLAWQHRSLIGSKE